MKQKVGYILAAGAIIGVLFFPVLSLSQNNAGSNNAGSNNAGSNNAGSNTTTTQTTTPSTVELKNPLCPDNNPRCLEGTSVPTIIGRIINGALGIVGSLALVMFIYGGFTWMLAGGNSEAVTKGRNIILWAAVGLVVIFTSYALVNFVLNAIT